MQPLSTVILENLRSAHNVGSIMRSCAFFGIAQIICVGTTPYPRLPEDQRPTHVREAVHRKIAKTALGAEDLIQCFYFTAMQAAAAACIEQGLHIYTLEQATDSVDIRQVNISAPWALIIGNEVAGVSDTAQKLAIATLEIIGNGRKESLNAANAAAVALYALENRARIGHK